jgi:hypothetical protein
MSKKGKKMCERTEKESKDRKNESDREKREWVREET